MHWVPVLGYYFFPLKITTNTPLAVLIILTVKGRKNFQKITGGREQKRLGNPAVYHQSQCCILIKKSIE